MGTKIYILILLVFCQTSLLYAQQKTYTLVCVTPVEDSLTLTKFYYQKTHADSTALHKEAQRFLFSLQQKTYLTASLDSIVFKGFVGTAYMRIGQSFKWKQLRRGNLSNRLVNMIGFRDSFFENKPFDTQDLEATKKKILKYSEDHGFPFATIKLDSIEIHENKIQGEWCYESGPKIFFDTISVQGDVKINPKFLYRLIKIKRGSVFNQSKVINSNRLLHQLPYIKVIKKPAVYFVANKAYTRLFLQNKKSNQIDGILGILPNEERDNQVLITGEVNLNLTNLFSSGKNLKAKWQRLQTFSQLLDLEYENPALFGSNLDFIFNFNLLRQDSSFVNNNLKLTLFYNLFQFAKLSFTLTNRKSNLGNSTVFTQAENLPDVSETKYFAYGIGYHWNNLNNYLYPRKGMNISITSSFGNKRIFKNPFLEDSLYQNINLNSSQIVLMATYSHYLQLTKTSVFLYKIKSGAIFNESLFSNDLFRIGGLKTLRGHNENIFFVSNYSIGTLEYRLFFEAESYIFLFYDQAFIQRNIIQQFLEDTPMGIGVGVSFAVKAGVFNFVYALGQSNEQRLNFNRSKIHFGLVSRF